MFCDSTLPRTQTLEWHKIFSEGSEVNEILPYATRTSVVEGGIERVRETVLANRCVDIRVIAENLNISYESTQHSMVNVLGMKSGKDKVVPKKLNLLQNRRRAKIAKEMFDNLAGDPGRRAESI